MACRGGPRKPTESRHSGRTSPNQPQPRRVALGGIVVGHVTGDNSTGPNHRPCANGNAGQDDGPRPYRCTPKDERWLGLVASVSGAGVLVVSCDDAGTKKNVVLEHASMREKNPMIQPAVPSDLAAAP